MAEPSDQPKRADQGREEAIAAAIRRYFAENPRASETLMGIAEWWVPRQMVKDDVLALQGVLRQMVDRGELETFGPSNNPYYRRKTLSAPKALPQAPPPHLLPADPMLVDAQPYELNIDHLNDELRSLDLRLSLLVGERNQAGKQVDALHGLVLSHEDMAELLSRPPRGFGGKARSERRESDSFWVADKISKLQLEITSRRAASRRDSISLALDQLQDLYDLKPVEQFALVACLAPEIDSKYEKLYAFCQDDINRRRPSIGLILDLWTSRSDPKWELRANFQSNSTLISERLLESNDGEDGALLSRSFRLSDRIADFLLGHSTVDGQIARFVELISPSPKTPPPVDPSNASVLAAPQPHADALAMIKYWSTHAGSKEGLILQLYGPAGSGKSAWAVQACDEIDRSLLVCDLEAMGRQAADVPSLVKLCLREARLRGAAIALSGIDEFRGDETRRRQFVTMIEQVRLVRGLIFIIGNEPLNLAAEVRDVPFASLAFSIPEDQERLSTWQNLLKATGIAVAADVDPEALAGSFPLTQGQIQLAAAGAAYAAKARSANAPMISRDDLNEECRLQLNPRFDGLATCIVPRRTWDDLVMSEDKKNHLKDVKNRILRRQQVMGEWKFGEKLSRGKGLTVLFTGPPGTGKTLAAEIIAGELGQNLYRIDLSQVLSKYIGETEKSLAKIFKQRAMLFFDECDALFGKRTTISDSHDRYSNVEVAFLLQQLEEYEGVVFLATNLRQNIDEAFLRRIQEIVTFDFPNEEQRTDIWGKVFPIDVPRAKDVDLGVCAREIRLSGAEITNIALAAAFLASARSEDRKVHMSDIEKAASREFDKAGQIWAPASKKKLAATGAIRPVMNTALAKVSA